MDTITSAEPSITGALAPVDQATLAGAVMPPQASNDQDLIDTWLESHRSRHTRRGYAADVDAFRTFTGNKSLRQIVVRDIQAFGASLTGLADATAARRLSAIKSLVAFGHRLGYLPFDAGAAVKVPAVKDTLAERILSESDVLRMLGAEQDPRNAALLRLVYAAGLRISEACSIRWRDLQPRDDAGQLTVFGKGGKTRAVRLPASVWRMVTALLGDAGPNDPVFRSRESSPDGTPRGLDASQVHRIVKVAAKRAGLSDAVSAHWLRHAHVSHALDRGAPVHVVRATAGHASLETTTRYSHARPGDSSALYLAQ